MAAECPHGENCGCAIGTRHFWYVAFCEERDKLNTLLDKAASVLGCSCPCHTDGWLCEQCCDGKAKVR